MRVPGRPRVLVLAPDALFRSFFDGTRQRRLSRSFRWSRSGALTLDRVPPRSWRGGQRW